MTTRDWFRQQRRQLWARHDQTAAELDTLSSAISHHDEPLAHCVTGWLIGRQPYRWDQLQRNPATLRGITD